ncbi:hypothetical protein IM25_05265 [Rhodococcus sp. p52]|nr:hypothetical protein IM25_05265 [Rhodococcus sp. p52]
MLPESGEDADNLVLHRFVMRRQGNCRVVRHFRPDAAHDEVGQLGGVVGDLFEQSSKVQLVLLCIAQI